MQLGSICKITKILSKVDERDRHRDLPQKSSYNTQSHEEKKPRPDSRKTK